MTHFAQYLNHAGQRFAAVAVPFAGLFLAAFAPLPAAAQSGAVADYQSAAVRYRVANLGSGDTTTYPKINSAGQVAFSLFDGSTPAAWTFDGKRIINLGTLGGSWSYTSGINERGHIAGYSSASDEGIGRDRAFRWTAATGMVDLGALGGFRSYANAINNREEIAGFVRGSGPDRAFRWSTAIGMEDLGILGTSESQARAMNDYGLIAGSSQSAGGILHSFVWTRARGIEDIGTLGGLESIPVAAGARGEVAGSSDTFGIDNKRHAYLWTRAGGMRDLGALGGGDSDVKAMSPNGIIVGTIYGNGTTRTMTWTAAHGMVDVGTLGGASARPGGVNSLGQVVGAAADKSDVQRAFSWTRAQGISDLNGRLVNAPAGLFLTKAEAVSDNGAIVASSNAGLVLLRPVSQEKLPAPVVGPIQLPEAGRTCCATEMQVAFTDGNPAEQHRVTVDWGDAFLDTALVAEKGGEGSASAHHIYHAPGLYTVVVRVIDSRGNASSLRRDLVVTGSGPLAAGSGRFMAPMGADSAAPKQAGTAAFRFVAPGAQAPQGMLSFVTERLLFRAATMSDAAKLAGVAGVQRMSGMGQLNGTDGYHYSLTAASAAPGSQARFGLRIWHSDPVSKAEVTDFDNARADVSARGSVLSEGVIAVAP